MEGQEMKTSLLNHATIKLECERALTALSCGDHTKVISLMKEMSNMHKSSSAKGNIHGSVAERMDDPNSEQQEFQRTAMEFARKAVELSPNSIQFALFYANLIFEAGGGYGGDGFEDVVKECERALAIENPMIIDLANEGLHDENQQGVSTPEARIERVQLELASLIQKANIASLYTWMKAGEKVLPNRWNRKNNEEGPNVLNVN